MHAAQRVFGSDSQARPAADAANRQAIAAPVAQAQRVVEVEGQLAMKRLDGRVFPLKVKTLTLDKNPAPQG
ncbi:MAG: hypothetical protein K0R66_1044 [Gammaproteobacteria bacterium]|jgi:hypothetical protein|nr:hypothetical protein [Gammaproteobacteria bacterium]